MIPQTRYPLSVVGAGVSLALRIFVPQIGLLALAPMFGAMLYEKITVK